MKCKTSSYARRGDSPALAIGVVFLLAFAGCGIPAQPDGGGPDGDDTSSNPLEDDDASSPVVIGDDDVTGEDDDSSLPGDDDTSPGDDDASSPGDDDVSLPGDDDASLPGDDDASPSGDDDISSAGDDDDSSPPASPDPNEVPPLPPGDWVTGLMLVSDTGGGGLSIVRMADSAQLWLYQLNHYMSDKCTGTHPCQTYEASHVVHDDRDYVDFAMSSGPNLQSSVHRIPMDDPEHPTFSLTGLDFTKAPLGKCSLPPSQTCGSNTQSLPLQCMVSFTHGIQMVADDPDGQKASIILTDSQNRILQVDLDYANGNSCGEVQWVLDFSTPSWDVSCPPNSVQYIQDNGNEYLGVTCRNLFGTAGEGQIQLFKGSGTGTSKSWQRVWTFPDPSLATTSTPYLNLPHHAIFLPYGDGSYYMMYAHSDGLASSWGSGDHGTMGSAWLATLESQPDYLADEAIGIDTLTPRFGFLKSVGLMPGGYRLVADSGSYTVQPPVPGNIYVIGPQAVLNDGHGGYWNAQHTGQNLNEVGRSVEKVFTCGWAGLYEADWLNYDSLGSYLRSAMLSPGGSCDLSVPPPPLVHGYR